MVIWTSFALSVQCCTLIQGHSDYNNSSAGHKRSNRIIFPFWQATCCASNRTRCVFEKQKQYGLKIDLLHEWQSAAKHVPHKQLAELAKESFQNTGLNQDINYN